jgi:hypothetical protein
MPHQPPNKSAILTRLRTERRRLEQNLATLSPAEMTRSGVVGTWSLKDVLAHLADWEAHMLTWVTDARNGKRVTTPGLGKALDEFNEHLYALHKDRSLEEVLVFFHTTHAQFMKMVEDMPEDEILTRSRYPFTGNASIYGWLTAYANHDKWGKTLLRKWQRSRPDRKSQ